MAQNESKPNPLAPAKKAMVQTQHPMMAHAQVWQHVGNMDPDEMQGHSDRTNHVLPLLGALASKPNVSRKDVIKAAADASGAGKVDPSMAVSFISQMPDDPDKLQPWLKNMYALQLTAAVHMKAALPQPGEQQS